MGYEWSEYFFSKVLFFQSITTGFDLFGLLINIKYFICCMAFQLTYESTIYNLSALYVYWEFIDTLQRATVCFFIDCKYITLWCLHKLLFSKSILIGFCCTRMLVHGKLWILLFYSLCITLGANSFSINCKYVCITFWCLHKLFGKCTW